MAAGETPGNGEILYDVGISNMVLEKLQSRIQADEIDHRLGVGNGLSLSGSLL